jgi:uncharacterized protein (TIGR02147 family)
MGTKPSLPTIYGYNDFRKFLADYQETRSSEKGFNKSGLCRKLGLPNTRSYFNDVIRGKEVSPIFVERFISAFELDKESAQYFRVLVRFNQAVLPEDRDLYFDQLIALNRTPKKVMDPDVYVYYREWYNSAIRAVLNIWDFNGNYGALAKKLDPPITLRQAREAVKLLSRLGLIKRNGNGFYKPTERSLTTGPYVRDELVKHYQMKCLGLAQNALLRKHSMPQDITTNMISISKEGYARIQARLDKFRAEIRSLVNKDAAPADRVYQLDILLFPNSRGE